jgi:hypothetical protein
MLNPGRCLTTSISVGNWSSVLEWAGRQMPVLDGKLVHPELGPVSINTQHTREPPSPDRIHFVDQWADGS